MTSYIICDVTVVLLKYGNYIESVGGSTPGVRVTWSTTAPPECVTSVRVVLRRGAIGSVVTSYTTTNTSGTQVI